MVIDFQTWITFAIASEFILLIPGPTILLVVAYSLSHGKTATFPLVTGVGLGDFTAMVFSFTGLGLLLNQASELFTLFKWVGALYLIYLGIQLWRMPVESTDWSDDTPMSQSPSRMLWHAWITTALNPKKHCFFPGLSASVYQSRIRFSDSGQRSRHHFLGACSDQCPGVCVARQSAQSEASQPYFQTGSEPCGREPACRSRRSFPDHKKLNSTDSAKFLFYATNQFPIDH